MKPIKVSEASDAVLNWMVAHVERKFNNGPWESFEVRDGQLHLRYCGAVLNEAYAPSADWAQGGPIIEREKIELRRDIMDEAWHAQPHDMDSICQRKAGPTPLIAAMRCCVVSKLGDTVEVPDEI